MSDCYLGLDLGGSGVKAGVFDSSGNPLGAGRSAYSPTLTPDGRAEIAIEAIYGAARDAVREAVSKCGAKVRAMAISSQGETFVALDTNDEPIHPVIIWFDARAKEEAERMKERVIRSSTGPVPYIDAINTAPKIIWLRDRHPKLMSRAVRYLLLPDYFSYRLTGEAVIDPDTASSSGFYAYDTPGFSKEALDAAGVSESEIARILPTGSPIAAIRPEIAEDWMLSPSTLLVAGTNDQYAGALGAGNCRPKIVSETTGTCLAAVTLTEEFAHPPSAGVIYGRFLIPRYQFALAYAKTAGVLLDWFTRELGAGKTLKELDAMAGDTPVGSNGVSVLPHFDGMISPEPNPNARGFFCNLQLRHTIADIYRAILESLTFNLRENLMLFADHGLHSEVIRSIGGGAKSDLWLQMKSDVANLPVERPAIMESATVGAAMIAAFGAGGFTSLAEASDRLYRPEAVFLPNPDSRLAYDQAFEKYRELYKMTTR